ncbi:AMP-binding protein [Paraherbaspirillum soli]|uniref:AMP-binding protein n=1 Tax=Paraherbaspirillum soli TaxID=631222 RepID=A0ABW0M3Y5_9BURK
MTEIENTINRVARPCQSNGSTLTCYQRDGVVQTTLTDLDRRAARLAHYLSHDLGLRAGDRIGIVAPNCIEWILLDLAAIKLKVVTAGFDPSRSYDDANLEEEYDLRYVFAEAADDSGKRIGIRSIGKIADSAGDSWSAYPTYRNDDITTLKFTSGSTGKPKGLGATVGSIDHSIAQTQQMFNHRNGDKVFVFLPLSLLQQRYWIYSALCNDHDIVVATYEQAFHAMKCEQPTVVMGVPGFFNAIRKHVETRLRNQQRQSGAEAAEAHGEPDLEQRRALLLDMLGKNIRYLWTGSAPSNFATLNFFFDCGLPIYEGYGSNETCIVSKNYPGALKIGSVGRVIPGKQVYLDDDGGIIVRSDKPVNWRYAHAEVRESEQVFLPNGDVRTGDLGYFDEDGYLYINGRLNDRISLANGQNVLLRPIEEALSNIDGIDECVLIGSGLPYLVAIVSVLNDKLDAGEIEKHISSLNASLEKNERIGKFIVADEPFTIANGYLTAQYKPARKKIHERYAHRIAQLV